MRYFRRGIMRLISFLTVMLIASNLYADGYTGMLSNNGCEVILNTSAALRMTCANYLPPDTLPRDTTKLDSISSSRVKKSSDSLDAPVKYHADDSTWMD